MTRQRLRPAYTREQLAELYPAPHNHATWPDHIERVSMTIAFAREYLGPLGTAADLSCGSAAILDGLDVARRYLGDLAAGYEFRGPIEETIEQIPHVGAFVCCETIEHLDDPDLVLKAIRAKTGALILSTPVDAWGDGNPEHYWAWSRADVEEMLTEAGFTPDAYLELDIEPRVYRWGVWGCQ